MRPICPDSRERKLNGAESGRSAAPRFRLLTAAMIKRLACLLPALLLPVLAAACAPVPPPEAGPASLPVPATAIPLSTDDPARTRVGALEYRRGGHLASRDPRFGGLFGRKSVVEGKRGVVRLAYGRRR